MLVDRWGRQITYLRVSVTDRCNLRCVYCMPPEGVKRLSHDMILRYEEIAQVVAEAAAQGVRKVRLTGGEPLVRPDLPVLVEMLDAIPGIEDISLTTNGALLERMAAPLKAAGLDRVNISLDTLQPEKFARITRGGSFQTTWRGIDAAEAVGLAPIKINAVAMRGVNDDELQTLARLSLERDWDVRFIELMPISNQEIWGPGFPLPADAYLSIAEIKTILAPLGLRALEERANDGPARDFQIHGARKGRIGFISPLSNHFCKTCNRMRITADGHFRPCLLHEDEMEFLPALRRGEPVLDLLAQAVMAKPAGHELALFEPRDGEGRRGMQQIGG